MDLLMNGLLLAATGFAGTYCWVLARRVRDLKSLDKGLGGAIVTLTRQVELARTTLEEARTSSNDTKSDLAQLVQRADTAAGQLRMLIAAAPRPAPAPPPSTPATPANAAPEPDRASPRREPPLTAMVRDDPDDRDAPAQQVRLTPRPRDAAVAIPSLDRPTAGPIATRPAPHLTEVPKPRALAPIENPLRRLRAAPRPISAEPATGESEDALLEALSALAGGR